MTIQEYSELAARTCPDLGSQELNVLHMDLGVNTEIGELLDAIKRNIAYGKELDMVNITEEFGDVNWYLVNLIRFTEGDLDTVSFYEERQRKISVIGLARELMEFSCQYNTLYTDPIGLLEQFRYISDAFGIDFEDSLTRNINKLRVRFPDRFTQEAALNRDLITERSVLEA